MGKEKSSGWDRIVELWEDFQNSIAKIANEALTEGKLEIIEKNGSIKPIPKLLCYSILHH